MAVSWGIHSFYGPEQVTAALKRLLPGSQPRAFGLRSDVPVRRVRRAGVEVLEAVFELVTTHGPGSGVVRLVEGPDGEVQASSLMTSLDELHAERHEDDGGEREDFTRDFSEPNWLDGRQAEAQFSERDPAVLVVGAGQAGLAVAARLGQLRIDTLVIDRRGRVGDNWRTRYHALVLHNEIWANHLPYMPFPPTWPTYIPKDLLADWFEAYANFMELNVWTGTELIAGTYDHERGKWDLRLRTRDSDERVIRPRHVVMASGVSGIPHIPDFEGLESYQGPVLHTSQFDRASDFTGKRVLVIGTGTSGHDVAQDLASNGADVVMMQRSPTTVVSVGPQAAGKVYSLYLEGHSTDVADLINVAMPYSALRHSYQLLTRELEEHDKELHEGLRKIGFKLDCGDDRTGFQMKYLRKGGGYYLDVGCSQMLVDGRVGLVASSDLSRFTERGASLQTGEEVPFDVIILATGYFGQEELISRLFGPDVAARVGPIWGYDAEGELNSMWRPTGQDGLWFTAGSLAQCRIYSKYLALQIQALERGQIDLPSMREEPRGALRPEDLRDVDEYVTEEAAPALTSIGGTR
jgi:putative flavoprotein involved in K+ transport